MTATPTTQAPTRPAGLPSFGSYARRATVIEIKTFVRNLEQMFFTFSLPVLLLVLFAAVFGNADLDGPEGTGTVNYAQYFLPGIIASGIVSTTFLNVASAVALSQHDGLLKRLSGTPLPRSAYFTGKLIAAAIATVVQTAIMLGIGLLFYDSQLPADAGRWAVFGTMLIGGAAAGCLLGLAYTRLIPNANSAAAIIQPPFLILQFISGVYFRYKDLPDGLQMIGSIFPLRWIAQGLRYAFLPDWLVADEYGSTTGGWEWPVVVLLLWLVASFVLAKLFFRWNRTE